MQNQSACMYVWPGVKVFHSVTFGPFGVLARIEVTLTVPLSRERELLHLGSPARTERQAKGGGDSKMIVVVAQKKARVCSDASPGFLLPVGYLHEVGCCQGQGFHFRCPVAKKNIPLVYVTIKTQSPPPKYDTSRPCSCTQTNYYRKSSAIIQQRI